MLQANAPTRLVLRELEVRQQRIARRTRASANGLTAGWQRLAGKRRFRPVIAAPNSEIGDHSLEISAIRQTAG